MASYNHLRRRVPVRYHAIEDRKGIWVSLHTDSDSIARQKAPIAWQNLVEAWEARLAGDTADAERRFEAARELAAVRGFRYLPAASVADLPREDLFARIKATTQRKDEPDPREAAAVLGGTPEPPITVSRALELYWGLAADKTIGKSEDQLRRWQNPRKKAVRNFISVVGDKALADITGDDMLDFRGCRLEKMEADGLTANSATSF